MKKIFSKLKRNRNFVKYFKNTSWLFLERILQMVVGLVVGVLLARYLGAEKYGIFSYAQNFVAIFSTIATLGVDGIIIKELVKNRDLEAKLIGSVFVMFLLGSFLTVFCVCMAMIGIGSNSAYTNMIICIMASATFFHSFNVIDAYFRANVLGKYIMYANSVIVVSFALKIIFILNDAPLILFAWMVFFDAFLLACSYLCFYAINKQSIKAWSFDYKISIALLKQGWPLIFGGIFTAMYMKIDQLMLKEMLGFEDVGVYAVAAKLSSVWYFIPIVISGSLFPAIVKAKSKSEKEYYSLLQKIYDLVVVVSIVVALITVIISDWLIDFLYGHEYSLAADVLNIHIWTGVFIGLWVVSSKWFTIENYLRIVLEKTIIGVFINVFLNYMLIPIYGIQGAAWATLFSFMFVNYLSLLLFSKTRVCFYQQTKALNVFRVFYMGNNNGAY